MVLCPVRSHGCARLTILNKLTLAILLGGEIKREVSSFLSVYLNFYMVVAESNELDANEGMAPPKFFARNVTRRAPQALKITESNELDANEGMAPPKFFARNVTRRAPQALKITESNELDASKCMALAQIFCAEARPND